MKSVCSGNWGPPYKIDISGMGIIGFNVNHHGVVYERGVTSTSSYGDKIE